MNLFGDSGTTSLDPVADAGKSRESSEKVTIPATTEGEAPLSLCVVFLLLMHLFLRIAAVTKEAPITGVKSSS